MRIGIDCRTILNPAGGEKAGVGHYSYYLVKNLLEIDKKNTYVLFFDHRAGETKKFEKKNVEIVRFPYSEYKKFLPFAYSHLLVAAELKGKKLDVFHSPANIIPLNYNKPAVITVHDLAIYRHPAWFPAHQSFSVKVLVPSSVKKAKKIIAVSASTKKDLIKLMNVPAQKIEVIPEAASKEKLPNEKIIKKFKLKENFILYVGTLEARKNLVRLIRAWEEVADKKTKKFKDWQLVIAGQKGHRFGEVFKAIKYSRAGHQIRYLGYVSHQEKIALMKKARVFAFPSLYEGFGLPVLEALQLGTPVLTSNISSLPEVAGKAALLVNPSSISDIAQKLEKIISNKKLRDRLSKLSKRQALNFSWQKCAQETLKVYKKALI